MILTMILVRGIRESARANNVLVLVKMAAILVFHLCRRQLSSSPTTGTRSCPTAGRAC
jgi:hypothetical protein